MYFFVFRVRIFVSFEFVFDVGDLCFVVDWVVLDWIIYVIVLFIVRILLWYYGFDVGLIFGDVIFCLLTIDGLEFVRVVIDVLKYVVEFVWCLFYL